MKALFLTHMIQKPVPELAAAVAVNYGLDCIVACGADNGVCAVNVCGSKLICRACKDMSQKVAVESKLPIEWFDPSVAVSLAPDIPFRRKSIPLAKIEYGVMSTIASHTRAECFSQLSPSWQSIYRQLLLTSVSWFNFFFRSSFSEIFVFNGRFCWTKSARLAFS